MDKLFAIILPLHILTGGLGLLAGTVVMMLRKGTSRHRMAGRIFQYAMMASALIALVLSVINPNAFLFLIGIWTLYLVGTGYHYITAHRPQGRWRRSWPRMLAAVMFTSALVFLVWGIRLLIAQRGFGLVMVVFGGLALVFLWADWGRFRSPAVGRAATRLHLQRMCGAYMAAATAFLVVNAGRLDLAVPGFIFWLLPTVLVTPLIIAWSGRVDRGEAF